jgi:glutamine amidotransferase
VTGRPRVAVIDYGIGNLRSAQKSLERVGADATLTADHDEILRADGVVLPGVGAFGPCMTALTDRALDGVARKVVEAGTPFLGICIGAQMLFESSAEAPGVAGLALLPGTVELLPDGVRRPQMQWNRVDVVDADHPLLAGLGPDPWMYFVHSYAPVTDPVHVLATCDYGGTVTAAAGVGAVWATQFHPEKSGDAGAQLLTNWIETL